MGRAMIRGEINALFVSADEGEIAEVSAALAEAPEIRLQSAPTLADAVERLRHTAFDLILLDLSQDGTNSFASLEPLGREAPDLPVIMLGAIEDDPRAEEAIAHGAADYLAKSSLSPAQLRRSIRYARDRWRARAELIRGRETAVQSARLRSEFLGNMSYEIRTSLNAIVGMSRLLIDTRLGRDQREMVETMRQSADALLKIVEDILDFSKLAAGSISLDERDFELGAVVAGAIALSAETAQRQGLKLASFIDTEVPALLRGDAGRLCQVLINLLSNAVKFTPTGEVTLQVAKLKEEDGNVTLHFSVKDSGIGVPFAAQRELFQAFDRADAAATRQFGGSGLSLAICAQLVELMGGTIGLESVPGQGSLFWFTARLRRRQVVIRAVSQPGPILAGMRVLVFDESPATARLIQEQLQGLGVACDSAASAAGAIVALKGAAANAQPYDLALIEIAGSPPQGLTLARAVKRDRTLVQTRVVGIYAPGAAPDQRRTRAAGVAAMLAKPVGQGELVTCSRLRSRPQPNVCRRCAERRERRANAVSRSISQPKLAPERGFCWWKTARSIGA